MTTKEVTR